MITYIGNLRILDEIYRQLFVSTKNFNYIFFVITFIQYEIFPSVVYICDLIYNIILKINITAFRDGKFIGPKSQYYGDV